MEDLGEATLIGGVRWPHGGNATLGNAEFSISPSSLAVAARPHAARVFERAGDPTRIDFQHAEILEAVVGVGISGCGVRFLAVDPSDSRSGLIFWTRRSELEQVRKALEAVGVRTRRPRDLWERLLLRAR